MRLPPAKQSKAPWNLPGYSPKPASHTRIGLPIGFYGFLATVRRAIGIALSYSSFVSCCSGLPIRFAPTAQENNMSDTNISKQQIVASYQRCLLSGTFFDDFYDTFVSSSPRIAEQFRSTDMAKQKNLLRIGLRHLIDFYHDPTDQSVQAVEDIGESHSKTMMDIHPELYAIWLDALMNTVKEHDPNYTEALGEQWRTAMGHGISTITAMYDN